MTVANLSLLSLFVSVIRHEIVDVSAWAPSIRNNFPRTAALSHRRYVVTPLYSTVEESAEALTEVSSTSTKQEPITVPFPEIQYTVPNMKLGWKENGVWYDEDGPRNGPTPNMWRQMSDERQYNKAIDLIQDLLKLNAFEANGVKLEDFRSDMLNELVGYLETRNHIRVTSLGRQIIGDWAPLVRGGKVIATIAVNEEKSAQVPYRFNIQRTAGEKLAPKTNYGTFQEHLEPGEELTVQELSSSDAVTSSGTFLATSEQTENQLVQGYSNPVDGELRIGGISYVDKYVMIMRKKEELQEEAEEKRKKFSGPITEVWMRIGSDRVVPE